MKTRKLLATFIDILMSLLAGVVSLGIFYGTILWIALYIQDPNQPYIDISLFNMAAVVTIFGSFATFSDRVNSDIRNISRCVGALHLISAIGFILLGLMLSLTPYDAIWASRAGYFLQGIVFLAFGMAILGFTIGTFLWVGRVHRLVF